MNPGLQLDEVSFQAGERKILEGVSLRAEPGECVALVGPNGAGKSTLFRLLLGLIRPSDGQVRWGDTPVHELSGQARAAAMAWLPQHGLIQEAIEVLEFVKAARFRFSEGRSDSLKAAQSALQAVQAESLTHQAITTLSGGELQRVMMASLIAQDAEMFLLDEPANHLDPAHQATFYNMLSSQWASGRGILCITHDINLLTRLAPANEAARVRVIGLDQGTVQFRQQLNDPSLPEALGDLFKLRVETVEVEGRRSFLALDGDQR
ncbi:MAG: ABC transporter ATP-binding protein [Myxococcota bacterium]|nr:ABC transporter ATP-binding protein [Myxococcota bacterium]